MRPHDFHCGARESLLSLRRGRLVVLLACAYASVATAVVIPFAINPTLRSEYFRLLAHWRAKVEPPSYVFIGDSITAGGGVWGWRLGYDPLSAINLGQNGLVTWQIANQALDAARYRPRMIVVMAGTNDAIHPVDRDELTKAWDRIFKTIGRIPIIVTLPPMTNSSELNVRIKEIDEIVRSAALSHSAKIIDLNGDIAPNGVIEPRYTVDGVHFTSAAYPLGNRNMWPHAARQGRGDQGADLFCSARGGF
jgi:lysophospholipase L1-like esterase